MYPFCGIPPQTISIDKIVDRAEGDISIVRHPGTSIEDEAEERSENQQDNVVSCQEGHRLHKGNEHFFHVALPSTKLVT